MKISRMGTTQMRRLILSVFILLIIIIVEIQFKKDTNNTVLRIFELSIVSVGCGCISSWIVRPHNPIEIDKNCVIEKGKDKSQGESHVVVFRYLVGMPLSE